MRESRSWDYCASPQPQDRQEARRVNEKAQGQQKEWVGFLNNPQQGRMIQVHKPLYKLQTHTPKLGEAGESSEGTGM